MQNQAVKSEKKLGEEGYVNKNCWLACNAGRPPSKRCQYCELRFRNCMFEHYLMVTLVLVGGLLIIAYFIEGTITRLFVASIFTLVMAYGYFFNKSTEKIIVSNFEEKKAKNAFKDLSDNLQDRVEEQTKEIRGQKEIVERALEAEQKAYEELKKLDQSKTQFMLITQHHLRTPLSANMGFIDLLKADGFKELPQKTRKIITRLGESTKEELKLINEMLDVSSYQLGKDPIRLEPDVDIRNVLKSTVDDLKIEAKKKGIYLKCKKCAFVPKIKADKRQLQLALANIIDNCVKYTQKGGVTLSLEAGKDKLLFIVQDTGMGIAKEDIPNIFNKFFDRSEESQKVFAVGKGIGLYLSGKIIESHKGRVWVESDGPGKGSTFYVELPIEQT